MTEVQILHREIKTLQNKLGFIYGKAYILRHATNLYKKDKVYDDKAPVDVLKLWDEIKDFEQYYKNL